MVGLLAAASGDHRYFVDALTYVLAQAPIDRRDCAVQHVLARGAVLAVVGPKVVEGDDRILVHEDHAHEERQHQRVYGQHHSLHQVQELGGDEEDVQQQEGVAVVRAQDATERHHQQEESPQDWLAPAACEDGGHGPSQRVPRAARVVRLPVRAGTDQRQYGQDPKAGQHCECHSHCQDRQGLPPPRPVGLRTAVGALVIYGRVREAGDRELDGREH
mmetsp:Transcript_1674/g.3646  ORF Transcript_1674/g.3646 Transcript_1674/m.3646 type:complete len:217 (-) Transcript_1674:340-990(-)